MNKLLTKIVGVALGLTMAIGVGVAVGVNNSEAREVDATAVPSGTPVTEITAGQYIITNGSNYLSGYNNNHITRTALPDGGITAVSSSYAFTLAVSSTGWSIYQNNQSKYIGYASKTNFSVGTTVTADSFRWSISASSEGSSDFTIYNLGTTDRGWGDGGSDIRPYQTPSSNQYFKFYPLEEVAFGDLDSISIRTAASKTTFMTGEKFSSSGLTITASDGTHTKDVISGFVLKLAGVVIDNNTVLDSAGTKTITIEYTENAITKSTSYQITVRTPANKLEMNQSDFGTVGSGSGYAPYNGNHVFGDYTVKTSQVMNQSSMIQFQKNAGVMYNVTPFVSGIKLLRFSDTLSNITITFSTNTFDTDSHVSTGDTSTVTTKEANSKYYVIPSGSTSYTYFKIECGNDTKKFTDIYVYCDDSGAERFATDFVAAMEDDDVCGTTDSRHNDNNATAVSAIWDDWKGLYNSLKSTTQGSFKDSTTSKGTQAKALYLHIVDRYKLTAWTNAPSGLVNISFENNNSASSATLVIILVASISLVAVSGYFVIRRRREN